MLRYATLLSVEPLANPLDLPSRDRDGLTLQPSLCSRTLQPGHIRQNHSCGKPAFVCWP